MDTIQTLGADATTAVGSDTRQYLTFLLDAAEYGVDILRVQEIKGWDRDAVRSLPNTPEYVRGVMNLRGTIVPIVDIRQRFALESMEYGPTTVVIVLKVVHDRGSRIMGIVVDAVSDVYNVTDAEMQPVPECGSAVISECVKGLATVHGKMVIMLDIDQLLNSGALATTTEHNDKAIKTLISDSVGKVEGGARLVDETGQALTEIVAAVKRPSGAR